MGRSEVREAMGVHNDVLEADCACTLGREGPPVVCVEAEAGV